MKIDKNTVIVLGVGVLFGYLIATTMKGANNDVHILEVDKNGRPLETYNRKFR